MTTTAIEPSQIIPLGNAELLPEAYQENLNVLMETANLTNKQKKILIALAQNVLSEDIQTDVQLAAQIGTSTQYIWDCRQNPRFARALVGIMRDIVKGTADKAIRNLIKHSEKDTKATEIWLRIAEIYQPIARNVNLNASIDASGTYNTVDGAIDSYLTRLIAAGWTPERLSERMRALMAEGVR